MQENGKDEFKSKFWNFMQETEKGEFKSKFWNFMQEMGKDYSKVKRGGQGCQCRVKGRNNVKQREKRHLPFELSIMKGSNFILNQWNEQIEKAINARSNIYIYIYITWLFALDFESNLEVLELVLW